MPCRTMAMLLHMQRIYDNDPTAGKVHTAMCIAARLDGDKPQQITLPSRQSLTKREHAAMLNAERASTLNAVRVVVTEKWRQRWQGSKAFAKLMQAAE